ncbi:MAG: hypothetical protein M3Q97_00930 [Bacteroidota bacterium]|nr:hypothetical protein [Bacteroidota bacterium]
MKKVITAGAALLMIALLATSCRKPTNECEDVDTEVDVPLSATVEAKIPYTGYDTLVFVHKVDSVPVDTLVLVGKGKRKYITEVKVPSTSLCEVYEYRESYSIVFKDLKNKDSLIFNVEAVRNDDADFFTYFRNYVADDRISRVNWQEYHGYYSELELNGIKYPDVNKFVRINHKNERFRLFYTAYYGILRMELESDAGAFPKNTWQLLK